MSDYIDTREGWREIDQKEPLTLPYLSVVDEDGKPRYWVRVEPVPPLPTEPHTVIRVTWRSKVKDSAVLLLSGTGDKWSGMGYSYDSPHLAADITGFEVLAEPRRDGDELIAFNKAFVAGAEAVIDRCREESAHPWAKRFLDAVARELGVES